MKDLEIKELYKVLEDQWGDSDNYINDLIKYSKGLQAELELYKDNQIHLINQLELKDKIIKEALRKLRASKDHFKTQQENNAVTFTIRILEKGDKE